MPRPPFSPYGPAGIYPGWPCWFYPWHVISSMRLWNPQITGIFG